MCFFSFFFINTQRSYHNLSLGEVLPLLESQKVLSFLRIKQATVDRHYQNAHFGFPLIMVTPGNRNKNTRKRTLLPLLTFQAKYKVCN